MYFAEVESIHEKFIVTHRRTKEIIQTVFAWIYL
jgi:hypothetical protein